LTPLAIRLGGTYPYISNLSLSLAVLLHEVDGFHPVFATVKVPQETVPRFIEFPGKTNGVKIFVPLEELIAAHLHELFPDMEILDHGLFRVTRDADFTVSDDADDLLQTVEQELRKRQFSEIVRVEIDRKISPGLRCLLTTALEPPEESIVDIKGMLDPTGLWELVNHPEFERLRDKPFSPLTQPRLKAEGEHNAVDIFSEIRAGDILVHHAYDSFTTSVERFVEQAVEDPDVLAIKQTVYRTSDKSSLVPALIKAADKGKQAVCLVELKARFDESTNVQWARSLEEAGVHVVYGPPGLKTHAKCILVVRKEGDGIRNYVHIGTGNYNATTARLYTDFGLLTCDEDLGNDIAELFNFLTGYGHPNHFRKILTAPDHLRTGLIDEIERTIEAQRNGTPSRIAMKMNSLVDTECIEALYRASIAGVQVDLNIRGICCLRPGVPGISESIRVVSVVGRFLEHSRVFSFQRGAEQRLFIGSADLMPRNLDHRVELLTPVEDPDLRAKITDVVERALIDDTDAWELSNDGQWNRRVSKKGRSVQRELIELQRDLTKERRPNVKPTGVLNELPPV
jgi:polyphosphate kinase